MLKEKGFEHKQRITLVSGRDLAVDVTLPVPGAVLILDPGPRGRKVFIDGREYAAVTWTEMSVPPGKHLVEVSGWKGTTLYSRHLNLEKSKSYVLDFKPVFAQIKEEGLKGHEKELLALEFSPDGKRLASTSKSGELMLWDIATKKNLLKINAHNDGITALDFSPDGDAILTGSWDGFVKIWDTETGQEMRSMELKKPVNAVAWNSNGKKVAAGCEDGFVMLWDVENDWKHSNLVGHVDTVRSLSFSLNGNRLVTGGADGRIILWSALDGTEIERFGDSSPVNSVIFTSNGEFLISGGEDGRIRVRKPDSMKVLALLKAHPFGKNAATVGEVVGENRGKVCLKTRYGITRILDMLTAEHLPRSC